MAKEVDKSAAQSARVKALWADPLWAFHQRNKIMGHHVPKGTPCGLNRVQAKVFWKQARFEASLTMNKLKEAGVIDDTDAQANEALHTALSVMRMPLPAKEKLAAARLVLDFTKAKPAQKTELTVNAAEDWLQAVTQDNASKTEGDTGADSST